MPSVSIIIPTLNEETSLGRTLRQLTLLSPAPEEIIVVDGGSKDETVLIAKSSFESFPSKIKTKILNCYPGRSVQMNYGAKAATGDILCFLHADTTVPD
ncbi:MAG: glycosyltransferase, partial [Cyanobacteriota bacterium]|nr:glycosyltransferase [Cyanobacteriota bacterium]